MAVQKSIKKAFAKRVAELREQAELTQIELGDEVGVSGTCIWNWERGNTFPRPAALKKLASALGSSVDYLMVGQGPQFAENEDSNRPLTDVIFEARSMVAAAAGVPISEVRVMLDFGGKER